MANEATLVTEFELPINMTVADSGAIPKGTALVLSDPHTVAAHAGGTAAGLFAGFLAQEKITLDGRTQAAVYKKGRFKVMTSGTIAVGDPLVLDTYANHFKSAKGLTAYDLSGTRIAGYSEETSTTGQTIIMTLDITPMNGV